MPCPICDGGGDRYACSREGCPNQMGVACLHCVVVYGWKCPECGAELIDLEEEGND